MPRHPIRVVAQRTGLTTAAIRAWERRYGAVRPVRSDGGQRLYTDGDVARLTTLRELTDSGRPIGMVAGLSDDEAAALLSEDRAASLVHRAPSASDPDETVEQAFRAMLTFDAKALENVLWHSAMVDGARPFIVGVVVPFLARIGDGWLAGSLSPAQEHMAVEVVDQILDRLAEHVRRDGGPKLIVATLPGETHSIGGRLVQVIAALDGWHVTQLGADLPPKDIAFAASAVGAAAVGISVVVADDPDAVVSHLERLREFLRPRIALFVGGRGAFEIADRLPGGVVLQHDLDGLPIPR